MPARKRKLKKSWLESYRDYIVRQESPDVFHLWVGMSMIATALRRNIFIDRGAYNVYPNLYTFLVAKSGRCRKSAAMDIGLDLVDHIQGIDILHGRMSVEGLIDAMNKAAIDLQTEKIRPDGSVLLHADELSYMFGKASYITDLISFLTAAYTAKAKLDFLTRSKGLCKVRNPCPSILAGTTPEQMGEIFPSMTLVSGFMARVVLVYGTARQAYRVAKPILNKALEEPLIHDLGCMADLHGPIKLTEEADRLFDQWYETMEPPRFSELESFYERKHDHVLKVALLMSVSESSKMIITKDHILGALKAVDFIETTIPQALAYIGATTQSNTADMIEAIVLSHAPEPVSHSVLMRRVYKRLVGGAAEFQQIIDGLKETKRIHELASDKGIKYTIGDTYRKFVAKKKDK